MPCVARRLQGMTLPARRPPRIASRETQARGMIYVTGSGSIAGAAKTGNNRDAKLFDPAACASKSAGKRGAKL